jgi:DNA/RNA-binding domain of Phe-tRNA-synthetase-like protein
MTGNPEFRKTERYENLYPGVAFGLALVTGAVNPENPEGFDQHKRQLLRRMRKKISLDAITQRIDTYDAFFNKFGYPCPLPKHLKRTINSGFPRYNLMVDAHFMAEMCAGILVAVTDFDRFDGGLVLDAAKEGEPWLAMGNRDLTTQDGEIVLRDQKDIVCVLCQGADEKTRVSADTRNVLFYAYAVPGIDAEYLESGLKIAAETMVGFGHGEIASIAVY